MVIISHACKRGTFGVTVSDGEEWIEQVMGGGHNQSALYIHMEMPW
jgi:hypothetical protein